MIKLEEPSQPRVSVIVPTTNQSERLAKCLAALAVHAVARAPFETIVVLNGASSAVADFVAASVTGARVVESPVNLGTAGGYNRGRSVARGELIALVHDDTVVEPGWLDALVRAADELPEVGVLGSFVLDPDGTPQVAGALLWGDGSTSPSWAGEAAAVTTVGARFPVDYVPTNSALVRAVVYDAIGGLDERFYPAYFVDVDLCIAAWARGWTVLVEPQARVRHARGSSTRPRERQFMVERNRARFAAKWPEELADRPGYDGEPETIEQALGRLVERAARIAAVGPPVGNPNGPLPLDVIEQEARSRTAEGELRAAYEQELERALGACEAELSAFRTREAERRTATSALVDALRRL